MLESFAEAERRQLMARCRNRMVRFRLDEISAVDKPAQEGAVMTILKRQGSTPSSKEDEMPIIKQSDSASAMDMVDDLVIKLGITRVEAMRKVARMRPALVEAYNKVDRSVPAPAPFAKSEAQRDFDQIIDRIQARDRCDRPTAMSRARRERPREFAAAYGRR